MNFFLVILKLKIKIENEREKPSNDDEDDVDEPSIVDRPGLIEHNELFITYLHLSVYFYLRSMLEINRYRYICTVQRTAN